VLADGQLGDARFVGTSDADGMLLLTDERATGALAYRLQGWRVVNEKRTKDLIQVWMARVE